MSDYLGQNIRLRYRIVSDGWVNGDGFYVDDIKVLKISNTVGLSQYNTQNDYLFYPNPAKDQITIFSGLSNQQKFCTIKLLDALGKVVLEKKSNESNTQLLINELPNGVYFLEITNENNRSFHSPLVILR